MRKPCARVRRAVLDGVGGERVTLDILPAVNGGEDVEKGRSRVRASASYRQSQAG